MFTYQKWRPFLDVIAANHRFLKPCLAYKDFTLVPRPMRRSALRIDAGIGNWKFDHAVWAAVNTKSRVGHTIMSYCLEHGTFVLPFW